jgi:hypothetical protein
MCSGSIFCIAANAALGKWPDEACASDLCCAKAIDGIRKTSTHEETRTQTPSQENAPLKHTLYPAG